LQSTMTRFKSWRAILKGIMNNSHSHNYELCLGKLGPHVLRSVPSPGARHDVRTPSANEECHSEGSLTTSLYVEFLESLQTYRDDGEPQVHLKWSLLDERGDEEERHHVHDRYGEGKQISCNLRVAPRDIQGADVEIDAEYENGKLQVLLDFNTSRGKINMLAELKAHRRIFARVFQYTVDILHV
jgi:hypothetical protein